MGAQPLIGENNQTDIVEISYISILKACEGVMCRLINVLKLLNSFSFNNSVIFTDHLTIMLLKSFFREKVISSVIIII